jgi:uncharacterized membrane protein (UPF0127 family)
MRSPVLLVLVTLLGGLALTGLVHVMAGRAQEQSSTVRESTTPETTTLDTTTTSTSNQTDTIVIYASGGERVEVEAEIADDPTEQRRGLMERTELAENAGMLFIFDREQRLSFFMKDTLIPLSVAFINTEGYIVDIQDMQPLDLTRHRSAEPAIYALEVNQGFFREHGVEVGNRVELPERPGSTEPPSSADVIQAFRDAGLEVGRSYPVEQEPDWDQRPVPKTYEEASRFEIPSVGEDAGGRVFIFESEEDLVAVRDYYEGLPRSILPYVYAKGKVLLQINRNLPEAEAERYNAVLNRTV